MNPIIVPDGKFYNLDIYYAVSNWEKEMFFQKRQNY